MRSDEKRRLRLNRETLRVLDRDALAGVAGGDDSVMCLAKYPKSNGWSRVDGVANMGCALTKG